MGHHRGDSSTVTAALLGGAIGAGAVYLADPRSGRRRRALLRDQVDHQRHAVPDALDAARRDLRNRSRGIPAELRYRVSGGDSVDERTLHDRVRAELGRVVRDMRKLEVDVVDAADGRIALRGPVYADEVTRAKIAARAVPGVKEVDDQLELIDTGDATPTERAGPLPEPPVDALQRNWAPATALVTGTVAGVVAIAGAVRGGVAGWTVASSAAALVARAATNRRLRDVAGVGDDAGFVRVEKTITVEAPVDALYELWTHSEQFPEFMTNVREVQVRDDGSQHWVVGGPLGTTVEFDAVFTDQVPNREIAWHTLPGGPVEHGGRVVLEPTDSDATRVSVQMEYRPTAGLLGHGAASVLQADPKTLMDEDLLRMKTLIETGRQPHDAAAPTDQE